MYVSVTKAAEHFGVCAKTIRRWCDAGNISFIRTNTNHRRIFIENHDRHKTKIIYARVSSAKQRPHLKNQIEALQKKYPKHTVISDIGSGINFKRKGFNSILDLLFKNSIEEVVVTSSDRFCRFGFEMFQNIFKRFGAKLVTVTSLSCQTPQEELAEDLFSIITVFTARHHGSRRYKSHKKNKNLSK